MKLIFWYCMHSKWLNIILYNRRIFNNCYFCDFIPRCGIINIFIRIVLFVTSYIVVAPAVTNTARKYQLKPHHTFHMTAFQNTSSKLKLFRRCQLIQADHPFIGLFLSVNWGLYGVRSRSGLQTSVAAHTLHFMLEFSPISFVTYPIENYRRHHLCNHLHSLVLVATLLSRRIGFQSRPTWLGFLVDSVAWNRY